MVSSKWLGSVCEQWVAVTKMADMPASVVYGLNWVPPPPPSPCVETLTPSTKTFKEVNKLK